jgi:hypothetical protein
MLQSPTLPDCNQTKTITPIGLTTVFERPVPVGIREAPIPTVGLGVISKTSLTTDCGATG